MERPLTLHHVTLRERFSQLLTERADLDTNSRKEIPPSIDFKTCKLADLVDDAYIDLTVNEPRRILQEMDKETIDMFWYQEGPEGPKKITIEELWHVLKPNSSFPPATSEYFAEYSGTPEMYSSPDHIRSIHGEPHQGGRVPANAYALGKYKNLNPSDMKVLLISANVHDMGRQSDKDDKDHGLRSAMNVDEGKNYLQVYRQKGITFTPEEIRLIKILCLYHEKPWEVVPAEYREDKHIATLIQTFHAADAGDRFRSPHKRWWPKKEYFMNFFDGDEKKVDAYLAFTKYFTLSSEKERLDEGLSVAEVMQRKMKELGIIKEPQSKTISFPSFPRRRLAA